jgi:pimeloyl-ACP methyl ester carboxylesterase
MFDNQNNAQNVLLGSGSQFTGAVSSNDATDYYKLPFTTASNLSLSLSGLTSDVNLYLYDNNSKLLASSTNPGNVSESIRIALAPGTYFAKVDLVYPTSNNSSSYKLDFSPNDPLFNNTPAPKVAAIPLVNSIVTQPLARPQVAAIPIVKNAAPQALVINGVKSSYDANSTLTIDPSYATDTNGWQDLTKVDFWLTNERGQRIELADANSFKAFGLNSVKFNYTTSLDGIAVGNYKLNALAYDKAGTASNLFDRSLTINPVFTLGFDGTTTNTAFINTFNQVNGIQILGKATGNVRGITGGTVQDFERGSIFQSTAGTFALQGTLNNFYKDLSASDKIRLGLPTATETSMGGYWHQSFQNGELQLVQGAPVKWSNQTLINERFTLLGGATSLGNIVGAIRTVNGAPVQDYDKGSIVVVGNSTVAILGSIATYYRANSATLGLPTGEESTTSYGKSQTFQNISVTSSTQFGVYALTGSLGGYYRGLTAAQKDQLGAVTTEEAKGGDGNWQQFFKGGSVFWKKDGTGEVKLTPFTIGFNGTNVNPTFTTEFNKIVGWEALGKVTGNVRSIAGGTVQDFEKGSIFQSAAGTFAVRGQIGAYYRTDSAKLGLPITGEIGTSYGWRQDFANGGTLIHSPQFGTQVLQGSLGGYYRGLSEAQRNQLGAVYTSEKNLGGGNWRQFFTGGTVEWKNNGTGEVKSTPSFSIGLTGNTINNDFIDKFNSVDGWSVFGSPISAVKTINGAVIQDFQKGSLVKTTDGLFIIPSATANYFSQNSTQLGAFRGTSDLGNGKSYQLFEKGVVFNSSSGVSALYGDWAKQYIYQMPDPGIPVGTLISLGNGITRQNFERGAIFYSPQFGTHGVAGKTWDLYNALPADRQKAMGIAISDRTYSAANGYLQQFQNGFISSYTPYGDHTIEGKIASYYKTLSSDDWFKLGAPTTNEISDGKGATYQFFAGGLIKQTISNGQLVSSKILSPFTIGYAGSRMVDSVIDAYVKLADNLGTPTGNVLRINGGYLQDFDLRMLSVLPTGEAFAITQNIENYVRSDRGQIFGLATGEGVGRYYGSQMGSSQTFQNGRVFYHPQFGTHGLLGNAQNSGSFGYYYESVLTLAQREQLGVATSEQTSDGNLKEHQSFQGGTLYSEYNSSTGVVFRFSSESYQPPQNNGGGGVIYIGSDPQPQPNQTYNKFQEPVEILTNWRGSVFKVDANPGNPPADFYNGGYNSPNMLAELNLGSNTLANGKPGISFHLGAGGFRNNLPGDNFAVRAYTQASFDGGQYTFNVRGDDGFQILAKNIVTNEWVYITSKDVWQTAYDNYRQINFALPQGRYDLHFHYFERGGLAAFDLSWDKTGNSTPLPNNNSIIVGYDGAGVHSTYQNTYNRVGGQNQIGFASGKVHPWANGYTQDFQGGTEIRGAIMKSNANDLSYWVGGEVWEAYQKVSGADGILKYATSDRYNINGGQRQDFQGGYIISTSKGTWAVFGGIKGQYDSEGANNGRLGLPTSGETGLGGGKIVQHFQNGDILLDGNRGKVNTLITNGNSVNYQELVGFVNSGVGLNLRQAPTANSNSNGLVGYNQRLQFDGMTAGQNINGNTTWYHIQGTNDWVSAAYISDTQLVPSTQQPDNSGQTSTNGGSSSTSDLSAGGTKLPRTGGGGETIDRNYHDEENDKNNNKITLDLVQNSGLYSAIKIDKNRKTWIVMHGMNGKGSDSLPLSQAIDNFSSDDQVLNVDWSQGAFSPEHLGIPDVSVGASHIVETASTIIKIIDRLGISANNLNLVGHSLGALLSYEISKQLYERKSGKVSSIIALDPATNTLSGYENESQVDFSSYSLWSWGFYGSGLGNVDKTITSSESFDMKFIGESFNKDNHGYVRDAFTDILNRRIEVQNDNSKKISNLFDLKILTTYYPIPRPWDFKNGFEAEISFYKSINGHWVPSTMKSNRNKRLYEEA